MGSSQPAPGRQSLRNRPGPGKGPHVPAETVPGNISYIHRSSARLMRRPLALLRPGVVRASWKVLPAWLLWGGSTPAQQRQIR
jgi:hypothetical protein